MNLTANLRQRIVEQFKAGHTMTEMAGWYEKTHQQIEGVIRDELRSKKVQINAFGSLFHDKPVANTGEEYPENEI